MISNFRNFIEMRDLWLVPEVLYEILSLKFHTTLYEGFLYVPVRLSYMPHSFINEPSTEEAAQFIEQCINSGSVITVAGQCEVDYEGRTSSFLPSGDRLLIRKPDGSLLVHQDESQEPVNWQPPGASFSTQAKEHPTPLLLLHSEQTSPTETIDIRMDKVYIVHSFKMKDSHEIDKVGTEEHIQQHIFKNPELVEEGLKKVEKEKQSEVGRIDIFARDENENPVIIEIKRRRGQPSHVDQLERYVNEYEQSEEENTIRGILLAPSATDTTKEMLDKKGFQLINPPETFTQESGHTTLSKFCND